MQYRSSWLDIVVFCWVNTNKNYVYAQARFSVGAALSELFESIVALAISIFFKSCDFGSTPIVSLLRMNASHCQRIDARYLSGKQYSRLLNSKRL